MGRARRWVLVWLLCGIGAADTSHAATYWVAPGGSDNNSGTQAAPWATLQRAANIVNAGDTVRVANGNYTGFDVRRAGTAANPITFLADGNNVRIVADNSRTPDGINIENTAHVIIDGFIADNRTRAGVRAAVSDFITIRNCRLGSNGRWGILTGFVDDLLVENNETHHSIAEHGIYASNSGDRPVIRNNWVHDNFANGIHINSDASQGGDGIISNALVEGNIIHGNGAGGGSGINMDGVVDSVVRNNLLYDNHASGISLYRIDGASGATNNLVVNNTIINADNARWCINIRDGSTGARVFNNILYNLHSFRGVISIDTASRPGFASNHNSVMSRFSIDGGGSVTSLAAWRGLGYDTQSFVALPSAHFVNPASDFHLLASSPAIDVGTSSFAPSTDLEGTARPQGAGYDVGAYERAASGTPPTPSPTPTFTSLPAATATRTATAVNTATRTVSTATRTVNTATRTATHTAPPPTATRTAVPHTATATVVPTSTRTLPPTATATRTAPATATATLLSGDLRIAGTLRHLGSGPGVPGAAVVLSGAGALAATSGAAGAYELLDVAEGAWRLTPAKSGDRRGAVSALDAAYVLQHVAGTRVLPADLRLACDVTASGSLSAMDATRILQLTVGLAASFESAIACGSDWLFAPQPSGGSGTPQAPLLGNGACQPGAIDYAILAADQSAQDFRALLIGDCTGNWQAAGASALASTAAAADVRLRGRGRRSVLTVRANEPVYALSATLAVDGVQLRGARAARQARNALLAANQSSPTTVLVGLASAEPIPAGKRIAVVLDWVPPSRGASARLVSLQINQ